MSQQTKISMKFALKLGLFSFGLIEVLIQVLTGMQYPWLLALGAWCMFSPLLWKTPLSQKEAAVFPTVIPDQDLEYLRNSYMSGTITLEDFEELVDRKLRGLPPKAEPKPELREGFNYIPESDTLVFTDKDHPVEVIARWGRS